MSYLPSNTEPIRYQERVYISSPIECIRNKSMYNVSCSSDLDIFQRPYFTVSGATSGTCIFSELDFTNVDYSTILLSAITSSSISATCIQTTVWRIEVYEDGDLVYTGGTGFFTGATSAETPANITFELGLIDTFANLGYGFDNDGLIFSVRKPYGVTNLTVDLCIDLNQSVGVVCTGGTSTECFILLTETYPTLTSGSTGVYILDRTDTSETVDFTIRFSGASFSAFTDERNIRFKYDIYKYNRRSNTFRQPAIYGSDTFTKENFKLDANTYRLNQQIPQRQLSLDGDYIIKGSFVFDDLTDYGKRLNRTFVTPTTIKGDENSLYDRTWDWYFVANYKADTPILLQSESPTPELDSLVVNSIYISCETVFSVNPITSATTANTVCNTGTTYPLGRSINGDVLVSFNGSVLSLNQDYTLSASTNGLGQAILVLELNTGTTTGDVITYAFVRSNNANNFRYEQLDVITPVPSGATGTQGFNRVFFNTTTGKFEIYTEMIPLQNSSIYVAINGVVLANKLDYYQSTTDPKRIILEGTLLNSDEITIYYNTAPTVVGDVYTNPQNIAWGLPIAPQANDGYFVLEISPDPLFSAVTQSASTNYVTGLAEYSANVSITGSVNTTLYYRIKNRKEYETLCGDKIDSEAFSEVVPIIIRNNAINSY